MAAHIEPAFIEPIRGRDVHLTLGGRACRVYLEEAGRGIPFLCLHTAGSDGRQVRVDSDFRERVGRIDTGQCPVFLLTGSYDFSCTPEDTLRSAAKIKGAEAAIMDGLGHFPMSEDPARFRGYILPVLEQLRGGQVLH